MKGFVKFTQPHNCRYLRHLPVTSNFEVCEIRLDVSKETAAAFKEQLDARHVRRRKRARDEKRREKRIQVRPVEINTPNLLRISFLNCFANLFFSVSNVVSTTFYSSSNPARTFHNNI